MEEGLHVIALGGNNGIIRVVQDKTRTKRGDGSAGRSEFGGAEAQEVVEIADAVADAKFAETVKAVTKVHSRRHLTLAVIGKGIVFVVDQERSLRGAQVGSEEPAAEGEEGPVKLRGDAVGAAELQIGAPFGALPSDVHEGKARAEGEGDVIGLRTIHRKGRLHERGRIGFFVHANQQPILAIFVKNAVGDAVIAPESGEAREILIEFRSVKRFANKGVKKILDVFGVFGADAFDAYKLGRADGGQATRVFLALVFGPIG